MRIKPVNYFTATVQTCWITTYNVDLGLFDSFLLPRLGEPPLNAVVLADARRLDDTLASIPTDEQWRLERANRRWLLRGVPTGASFHPKTLLFTDARRATLLVGSGNLSLSGLDTGHETFTAYRSDDETGRQVIASWHAWMHRLLDLLPDDDTLRRRFTDLTTRLPDLPDASDSAFLHNLDRSILDRLVDRLPDMRPDHLHLAAPFYDPQARAVAQLLARLQPRRLTLYLCRDAKVDGTALRDVLDDARLPVTALRYIDDVGIPIGFVHAKLIGLTYPSGDGFIVGGSANLSQAALLSTPSVDGWANVEAASIAQVPAEELVLAFTDDSRLRTEPTDLRAIADLTFDIEPDPAPPEVRLLRAERRPDGTLGITTDPSQLPPVAELTDGASTAAIDSGQNLGPLIWLVDDHGKALSNRCVVDVPGDLERQLGERSGSDRTKPAELSLRDLDHPLGKILEYIHETCIMDIADTSAVALAEKSVDDEAGDSDDMWTRLANEELQRDPRMSTYQRVLSRSGTLDDPLTELLAAMLARAPKKTRLALQNVIAFPMPTTEQESEHEDEEEDEPPTRRWATTTRIRVRARNVLQRWADAISDPRLAWLDPYAPLVNYRTLIDALALLWAVLETTDEDVTLRAEDLTDIAERLVDAIISATEDLPDITDRLHEHTPALTAAITYLAIRPGPDVRQRKLAWQPRLTVLLDAGLLDTDKMTSEYLSAILPQTVTTDDVDAAILGAIEFMDDAEWCRRTAKKLGASHLSFGDASALAVDAFVLVGGIDDPLASPQTVQLMAAVREYTKVTNLAIRDADKRWHLSIQAGQPVAFDADWLDGFVDSLTTFSAVQLTHLMQANASLAELFAPMHRAA